MRTLLPSRIQCYLVDLGSGVDLIVDAQMQILVGLVFRRVIIRLILTSFYDCSELLAMAIWYENASFFGRER